MKPAQLVTLPIHLTVCGKGAFILKDFSGSPGVIPETTLLPRVKQVGPNPVSILGIIGY